MTAYIGSCRTPAYSRRWDKFAIQWDLSNSQNPITLSIGGLWVTPRGNNRAEVFYLMIGVDVLGRDSFGMIKINFKDSPGNASSTTTTEAPVKDASPTSEVMQVDYTKLKPRKLMSHATGYIDSNLWLDCCVC